MNAATTQNLYLRFMYRKKAKEILISEHKYWSPFRGVTRKQINVIHNHFTILYSFLKH